MVSLAPACKPDVVVDAENTQQPVASSTGAAQPKITSLKDFVGDRPLQVAQPKAPEKQEVPAPEDVAKPPADAKKTPSGLVTKVLTAGTGKDKPKPEDRVKVHYTGWTADGKMFDSSVVRGEPTSFGVTQVIKGWTEGLQLMREGDKMRFWIPAELAYGEKPSRPGAPAGMLVFDVELLQVL